MSDGLRLSKLMPLAAQSFLRRCESRARLAFLGHVEGESDARNDDACAVGERPDAVHVGTSTEVDVDGHIFAAQGSAVRRLKDRGHLVREYLVDVLTLDHLPREADQGQSMSPGAQVTQVTIEHDDGTFRESTHQGVDSGRPQHLHRLATGKRHGQ